MSRRLFLFRFLLWLDRERVPWCLLRNFEELPATIPDDLDILIDPAGLAAVEHGLRRLGMGMRLLRKIERNGHTQFLLFSEEELDEALEARRPLPILQLDFVTAIAWEGLAYVDLKTALSHRLRYRSLWILGPDEHAAHLIGHALLDKGEIQPAYRQQIGARLSVSAEPWDRLAAKAGPSAVGEVREHWKAGNERSMRESLIYGLSSSVSGRLTRVRYATERRWRQFRALLRPPGKLVAAVGPDGSGKTTLLSFVAIALAQGFDPVRTEYMGWREFLLPTKRILRWIQSHRPADIQTTTGQVERSRSIDGEGGFQGRKVAGPVDEPPPPWTHNFSLLHYGADLWARYGFRIRPSVARGGLVLCDRYFFDLLLHRVWISDAPLPSAILRRFSPMPDVLVFFDGDPELISARKNELTPAEVTRQLDRLQSLRQRRQVLCLDVARPVMENVREVVWRLSQPLAVPPGEIEEEPNR